MNRQKNAARCTEGTGPLPSCAALAVPYVPVQPSQPKRYEHMDALAEGTLFPGLNLPFHLAKNGRPVRRCPRTELMALGFVVHELGLYLDTHPSDSEAFALFRKYAELLETARNIYTEKIGPLKPEDSAMDEGYTWVNAPWPWQNPDKEA